MVLKDIERGQDQKTGNSVVLWNQIDLYLSTRREDPEATISSIWKVGFQMFPDCHQSKKKPKWDWDPESPIDSFKLLVLKTWNSEQQYQHHPRSYWSSLCLVISRILEKFLLCQHAPSHDTKIQSQRSQKHVMVGGLGCPVISCSNQVSQPKGSGCQIILTQIQDFTPNQPVLVILRIQGIGRHR